MRKQPKMTKMDNRAEIAKYCKTKQGRHRLAHSMTPDSYPVRSDCRCNSCLVKEDEAVCESLPEDCKIPIGTALAWNEVESSIGDTKAV